MLGEPNIKQMLALYGAGRFADMEAIARSVLPMAPNSPLLNELLGIALSAQNRHTEALTFLEAATRYGPGDPQFWENLGLCQQRIGEFASAEASLRRALSLRPQSFQALVGLASVLRSVGRVEEAIGIYGQLTAALGQHHEVEFNLGNALLTADRPDEALACFDKALVADRRWLQAWNNRGRALMALNRYAEAVQSFDEALALAPDDAEAHFNKGLALLAEGRFEAGWLEHEWRRRQANWGPRQRNAGPPLWEGECLPEGSSILVFAEQGLGDSIQFVRYVPALIDLGFRVTLEVQAPLVALFSEMPAISHVIALGATSLAADVQCSLMSLPFLLKVQYDGVPNHTPYLQAPAKFVETWQQRVPPAGLSVGVVWAGNPSNTNDAQRSIPLENMRKLFGVPNVRFVSLQKTVKPEERQFLNDRVVHVGDQLDNFADTAAVIDRLDLVISADTSVAHLAGALGKPVWVLVPFSPGYRWMTQEAGSTSHWYPNARVFRKSFKEDWSGLIARVCAALAELAPGL
jgi:tetratricopeptide (TPR) repeat protein